MRVILVDDHAAFRQSASVLLELEGVRVVATAESGEQALQLLDARGAKDLGADLILVDLRLPGMDGVDVSEAIAERLSPLPVILISSHDEAASDPRVVGAPVLGFLPKRDLTCAAILALLD
jgi:DNA-binding NarL/FixJ family response regulator